MGPEREHSTSVHGCSTASSVRTACRRRWKSGCGHMISGFQTTARARLGSGMISLFPDRHIRLKPEPPGGRIKSECIFPAETQRRRDKRRENSGKKAEVTFSWQCSDNASLGVLCAYLRAFASDRKSTR